MRKKIPKGFTLIEIMVVVGIVSVLSTAVFITFSDARKQSRDQVRVAEINKIAELFKLYEFETGSVPACSQGTLIEKGLPGAPPSGGGSSCADKDAIINFLEENMSGMPHDPLGPGHDQYFYVYDKHKCDTTGDGNDDSGKMILFAQLESDTLANKDEVCGKVGNSTSGGNNQGYYNYHSGYNKETNVYVVEISCVRGRCI